MAMNILRRQGLWAWMRVIAIEVARGDGRQDRESCPPSMTPVSAATAPVIAAPVCAELLVAWTDVLVGVITREEIPA